MESDSGSIYSSISRLASGGSSSNSPSKSSSPSCMTTRRQGNWSAAGCREDGGGGVRRNRRWDGGRRTWATAEIGGRWELRVYEGGIRNLRRCSIPGGTAMVGSKQRLHFCLLKRSGLQRKRPQPGISDVGSSVTSVGGDVHTCLYGGGGVPWQRRRPKGKLALIVGIL